MTLGTTQQLRRRSLAHGARFRDRRSVCEGRVRWHRHGDPPASTTTGPINPSQASLTLTPTTSGTGTIGPNIIGHHNAERPGLTKTYYTEIQYNALGVRIATNEDTGLWRRFGVDANGNVVETDLYGTQAADTAHLAPVVTYKEYDERNLVKTSYGAGNTSRPITRMTYDYDQRMVSEVDPGNTAANTRTFQYDDVGNTISSTDALGNVTTSVYNVFEQLVVQAAGTRIRAIAPIPPPVCCRTSGSTGSAITATTSTMRSAGKRSSRSGTAATSTTRSATWDQHDRMTTSVDGLGNTTYYYYDKRDNQTWVEDANGHWFGQAYDDMGQVTHTYAFQGAIASLGDAQAKVASNDASLIDEASGVHDLFGNRISQIDAAGHRQTSSFGAFGRLVSSSSGGIAVNYTYDRFGNKVTESSVAGKDLVYQYDDAGELTEVNDRATHTLTDYTYDAAGRRSTEVLTKNATVWSSLTYHYNANGWMIDWTDTTHTIGEKLTYDAAGNVKTVVGVKSGNAAYFTHNYSYDAADRVTQAGANTYTYDARGRRATWNDGTNPTVTYTYDGDDRVTAAAGLHWTYDKIGNVTSVTDSASIVFTVDGAGIVTGVASGRGASVNYTISRYDSNNVLYYTESNKDSGYTGTTTNYDKSGRVSTTVLTDASTSDVKTFTYTHTYNADGTEASITASGSGSVTGSSLSTYDVNGQLVSVDLGKGDGQDRNETKTFSYDNAGHIISALHDPGKGSTTTVNYLYANDNPAGEYPDASTPTLDEGNYSVIQNVDGVWGTAGAPNFPASSPTLHVVTAGETLQSIASQVYGHPELWYVIADANGLTGSEALQTAGQRLNMFEHGPVRRLHRPDAHVLQGRRHRRLEAAEPAEPAAAAAEEQQVRHHRRHHPDHCRCHRGDRADGVYRGSRRAGRCCGDRRCRRRRSGHHRRRGDRRGDRVRCVGHYPGHPHRLQIAIRASTGKRLPPTLRPAPSPAPR